MKLKTVRISHCLTQKQIADLCKVTVSAVSQWEKGTTTPTAKTLLILAKAFGCSVEDLLAEEDGA